VLIATPPPRERRHFDPQDVDAPRGTLAGVKVGATPVTPATSASWAPTFVSGQALQLPGFGQLVNGQVPHLHLIRHRQNATGHDTGLADNHLLPSVNPRREHRLFRENPGLHQA
jgi:hypothetical protein